MDASEAAAAQRELRFVCITCGEGLEVLFAHVGHHLFKVLTQAFPTRQESGESHHPCAWWFD